MGCGSALQAGLLAKADATNLTTAAGNRPGLLVRESCQTALS